jgi:hypothetical protein
MATLGTMFAGSWLAMGGGEKPKTAQGPPISASSKDEEQFIQCVHPLSTQQTPTQHNPANIYSYSRQMKISLTP